jgi:hypothetical protein
MLTPIISKGNSKIGPVFNVSLPPGTSCIKTAPCRKQCYALKAWRMYDNVRQAWAHNWKCYQGEPDEYFLHIEAHCRTKRPKYFRWHVAGDIPDLQYARGIVVTALMCPHTKFLVFTKNLTAAKHMLKIGIPKNLSVVLSAWPGPKAWMARLVQLAEHFPVAWLDPCVPASWDIDPRTLANYRAEKLRAHATWLRRTKTCPGSCETCMKCWGAKHDTVFHAH